MPASSVSQDKPNLKEIGRLIKKRRQELRITQVQLAEILEVSVFQVQKYEAGINNFKLNVIMRLARALSVSVAYFFPEFKLKRHETQLPPDLARLALTWSDLTESQRKTLIDLATTLAAGNRVRRPRR